MSIILDLIIVFIVLLFVFLSAKKGFVRTLIEVVGFVLAIILALNICVPISDFLYEKTVRPAINKTVETTVLDGTSSSEETLNAVLNKFPSFISESKFLTENKEDYMQAITNTAVTDSVALSNTISDAYIKPPITKLFSIFVSIILMIIFLVLVSFLAKLINKLFSFSVVGKINRLLGGLLGAVKGIAIAIVFCVVVSLILSFSKDGFLFITREVIDSSYLFKILMDFAPFL